MFISNELAFIELHKTACTHIGKLLASILNGNQYGKHNSPPSILLSSERSFVGSVRNPWDWYISLWAYGCDKKGRVYNVTTRPLTMNEMAGLAAGTALLNTNSRKPDQWKRCYSDIHSASAFQDWLHMMNDKNHWNDFGEGYGTNPIARFSGLLTYRYISLFCKHASATITSVDDIKNYVAKNCFINHFIRMENLEDDFVSILKSCGIHITESQKQLIYSEKKTNTSSPRKGMAFYYNDETVKLIQDKESLIIDKFSYAAPEINK